jgi:hypothetical protein
VYQEYAIDPTTLCKSFDRFKLIWNGLGYSEGRLLSKFPTKWEWKLLKSDSYKSLSDGQRNRILDILATEQKNKHKIISSGREYESNTPSWLEEAERVHSTQPFHAILAEDNPRTNDSVACFDDLGVDGDCWCTPRPWQVKRHHTDMAKAAGPLLQASKEILFIEPYFKFSTRFTRPLKKMLETVQNYERKIERIEIHLKEREPRPEFDSFLKEFEHNLRDKVKDCCTRPCDQLLDKLEFYIWESPDDNRMHPRYILTDVAGLGFENGLDEDMGGDTFTDVSLLAGASLTKRWKEFQPESAERRLIHSFKASSC